VLTTGGFYLRGAAVSCLETGPAKLAAVEGLEKRLRCAVALRDQPAASSLFEALALVLVNFTDVRNLND
jgi:hypothetical protein